MMLAKRWAGWPTFFIYGQVDFLAVEFIQKKLHFVKCGFILNIFQFIYL
jgi:hypothetical protein